MKHFLMNLCQFKINHVHDSYFIFINFKIMYSAVMKTCEQQFEAEIFAESVFQDFKFF